MAISKRELSLSQELMDLDRIYNELNRRYNNLNILHNDALNRLIVLEAEKNKLEDTVSILKSLEQKSMSPIAKKYAPKAK